MHASLVSPDGSSSHGKLLTSWLAVRVPVVAVTGCPIGAPLAPRKHTAMTASSTVSPARLPVPILGPLQAKPFRKSLDAGNHNLQHRHLRSHGHFFPQRPVQNASC